MSEVSFRSDIRRLVGYTDILALELAAVCHIGARSLVTMNDATCYCTSLESGIDDPESVLIITSPPRVRRSTLSIPGQIENIGKYYSSASACLARFLSPSLN